MGRKRIYDNATERQRAHRERIKGQKPAMVTPNPKCKKKTSRPARLAAIGSAISSLLTEYQDWLSRLPESLSEGDQASLLTDTIEKLEIMADVHQDINPPRGFGRD